MVGAKIRRPAWKDIRQICLRFVLVLLLTWKCYLGTCLIGHQDFRFLQLTNKQLLLNPSAFVAHNFLWLLLFGRVTIFESKPFFFFVSIKVLYTSFVDWFFLINTKNTRLITWLILPSYKINSYYSFFVKITFLFNIHLSKNKRN